MIIQMQAGVGKSDPRVAAVVEKAKQYRLNPLVHSEQGTHVGVVEIHLKDGDMKTSALSEHIFVALDGVENVRRVTRPKVTLSANGMRDGKHIKLSPSTLIGAGLPCQIVAGPCTVDEKTVGPIVKGLVTEYGITAIRGGGWKPRSSPYSFPGYGERGIRLLLNAAGHEGIGTVFTEVMESQHITAVARIKQEVGYTGTVVPWVGARTGNPMLLSELGKQYEFPVMLKNSISAKGVDDLFERAERVLAGPLYWNDDGTLDEKRSMVSGNDNIILCLRGTEKTDPKSSYRFRPNHDWAETLRARSWAPIAIDPSHSAGTMENDLVLKNIRAALQHDIDMLIVEGGYPAKGFGGTGFRGLCDAEQSFPLERFGEILNLVSEHNRAFKKQ